jgi:hypothetical protein
LRNDIVPSFTVFTEGSHHPEHYWSYACSRYPISLSSSNEFSVRVRINCAEDSRAMCVAVGLCHPSRVEWQNRNGMILLYGDGDAGPLWTGKNNHQYVRGNNPRINQEESVVTVKFDPVAATVIFRVSDQTSCPIAIPSQHGVSFENWLPMIGVFDGRRYNDIPKILIEFL